MLKPKLSSRFKKDYALIVKRNYDMSLLDEVVDTLLKEEPLPAKYKDHSLKGNYKNCRECHILPDWLLIYQVEKKQLLLHLMRTGTHSDLLE